MMTHNKMNDQIFDLTPFQKLTVMPLTAAAALIGPLGGLVEVSDPESPIFGTSIEIPDGALDTHELIRIEEGSHACAFGLAPSVKFFPEGLQFNRPVEVRMCFKPNLSAPSDIHAAFYVYDESKGDWAIEDDALAAVETGIAKCLIRHL